ncbi:MAG: ABC transporter permease [Bacteroidales bacterium]|nr:ABC transporter permease [Bacteroidales bacterium]
MIKPNVFSWILWLLSGIVLLFIIAPLVQVFLSIHYSDYHKIISDNELHQSLVTTILIGFITSLIFSLLAIPLAYVLARKQFPLKRLIISIIDIPIVIPHTAAGIALLTLFSSKGFFPLNIIDKPIGIGLAMAFVSIPFLIQSAREGFISVPEKLEKASLSLGINYTQTFFKISLPLAWQHIVSGFIMMFARGISEFGAIIIIAYRPTTSSVLLFERFNSFGLSAAQPVAATIIVISLIIFVILRLLASKN